MHKRRSEGKQQTITTGEDIYSFTLYISPQLPPILLYLRKKKNPQPDPERYVLFPYRS